MANDYYEEKKLTQLTYWVTGQMLKGAGAAAICLIGVGLVIWAIYGVGLLLPAESRETPDPNASLEQPLIAKVTAYV